jgi:hypothetical protein
LFYDLFNTLLERTERRIIFGNSAPRPPLVDGGNMWLINTESLKLEDVVDPDGYEYAILSHTWEDGEVSFQEMADIEKARAREGFLKVERTCKLASDRGIEYAWVDTCCIDKSSSAELTEAINSMFQWYKKAYCLLCVSFGSDTTTGTK